MVPSSAQTIMVRPITTAAAVCWAGQMRAVGAAIRKETRRGLAGRAGPVRAWPAGLGANPNGDSNGHNRNIHLG